MPQIKGHDATRPTLSIIVPCYNEEGNVRPLYVALLQALKDLDEECEFLFVDDGSTDGTLPDLRSLHAEDGRLHYISFSRNFGHQYALLAGLYYASGKACITMDADMEHPPALLPAMVRLWQEGYDVVNTRRSYLSSRSLWKRLSSRVYYRVFSLLAGRQFPYIGADFRLLDRRVVRVILAGGRDSLFLRGMVGWVGFRQCTLPYVSGERYSGQTHYPLSRMMRLALEGLTSYSLRPLRVSLFFSFLFALPVVWVAGRLIYAAFWNVENVSVDLILVALICFLGSVILLVLGIVGEYLGRCFMRLRDRPLYVVAESDMENRSLNP